MVFFKSDIHHRNKWPQCNKNKKILGIFLWSKFWRYFFFMFLLKFSLCIMPRYSVWLFSFPRNEGVKIWTRSKHFSFYFRPILKLDIFGTFVIYTWLYLFNRLAVYTYVIGHWKMNERLYDLTPYRMLLNVSVSPKKTLVMI
jgi:hypothetical protein